jgi:quinol monooxygenase YgiN
MITITALIRVKNNSADLAKLNVFFVRLIDETRKEPGCRKYDLHKVTNEPGFFIMMEEWASDAAMENHNTSQHFKNFVASAEPYFTAPIEEFQSTKAISEDFQVSLLGRPYKLRRGHCLQPNSDIEDLHWKQHHIK